MTGAVGTTVETTFDFCAVADRSAPAMLTSGGHFVNGAFEAVEHVVLTARNDFEGLVVVVAANLAGGHGRALPVHRRGRDVTQRRVEIVACRRLERGVQDYRVARHHVTYRLGHRQLSFLAFRRDLLSHTP
jgi:hypothetical protein